MSREPNIVFLEEWLNTMCGHPKTSSSSSSSSTTASAIIQSWTSLRNSLQQHHHHHNHLLLQQHQHLKTLVNSQSSLHVADPQATLLLSILSNSNNSSLPRDSYPLIFRLLYIWARKSTRPNPSIIDSTLQLLSTIFSSSPIQNQNNPFFFSESILLLGSFSFIPSLSLKTKTLCLELFSSLLTGNRELLCSVTQLDPLLPRVLAGIGYALSSSVTVHYPRIVDSLFGIWSNENGTVLHGLMVLYLIDWVMTNLINFRFLDKIRVFLNEGFEQRYAQFAVFMASVGVLRAANRFSSMKLDVVSEMKTCAVVWMEGLVSDLVSRTMRFGGSQYRLLLQCVALALARTGTGTGTGSVSGHSSLLVCLALALLNEVFPLRRLYELVLELCSSSGGLKLNEIKEHVDSVLFKEAGAVTGVFCNQYVLADEESKRVVENLMWGYCRDIYFGHRQVAMLLKGKEDALLEGLEKIAESAFLMVVVFALAVAKHKLNSKFGQEIEMEVSLEILVSFSCVEYFRRVRLPEYMDTIRKVVASVNKNEHACTCFMNSMPSYVDLTNGPSDQKTKYLWSKDEVQTARILFYLRVIPTFIECLPSHVFRNMVAPTMFLYMEHLNGKVARASHSVFVAFMSMGKESEKNDKVSLKEQLVFHYIQRSLLGYPGITPFEGMASGVVGIVQHLPAGSPAIFYCIHSLVEKTNQLCSQVFTHEADAWKKWQGEPEPSKKLMDLLLRLVFLVDIQVLPNLMKLLAQLITTLPQDAQNIVLNELYSQVADSDDVIRKPTLVSWLQSLSYLCTKTSNQNGASKNNKSEDNLTSAYIADPLSGGRLTAQL
ncbi:uncharacterized protein LOC133284405 isoform X2 [Gastrolobium bilobum]|uniref:uncharacterized protein LOC133284405 isoform X2 n=1 Tax=Gastrolobium bilobum TaxID=150636 RepID=UPI002AB23139|nr:uncharacterized protein LOC133284405 isoform X2 [Gastrolobium bilobum]